MTELSLIDFHRYEPNTDSIKNKVRIPFVKLFKPGNIPWTDIRDDLKNVEGFKFSKSEWNNFRKAFSRENPSGDRKHYLTLIYWLYNGFSRKPSQQKCRETADMICIEIYGCSIKKHHEEKSIDIDAVRKDALNISEIMNYYTRSIKNFGQVSKIEQRDSGEPTQKLLEQNRKNPALVFKSMSQSGFEFVDLANAAKDELFICGQNLYGLCIGQFAETVQEQITILANRGVAIRFMICDIDFTPHIDTWAVAVGNMDYGEHLRCATKIFKQWDNTYTNLEVRVTKFVPTSMCFLDPLQQDGIATITPHHYQRANSLRPVMIVSRQFDDDIFDIYYKSMQETWNDTVLQTRPISKVQV